MKSYTIKTCLWSYNFSSKAPSQKFNWEQSIQMPKSIEKIVLQTARVLIRVKDLVILYFIF